MKLLFTLFTAGLFSLNAASQASAVIFSEMGENFTAFLNGQKQNNVAANNVRMDNLTGEFYQLRVDFEDASIKDITANMAVQAGTEVTYVLKLNKKGEHVLRYFAEAPMGGSPAVSPSVQPAFDDNIVEQDHQVIEVETDYDVMVPEPEVEITVVETTTVKTSKPQPAKTPAPGTGDGKVGISINVDGTTMEMDMNVNGVQMDMDVDGMDTEMEMDVNQTQTVTTTTKTTTTRSNTKTQVDVVEPEVAPVAKPVRYSMPGYNGPVGCDWPMESNEFSEALESIRGKSFSDSKMTLAKQITKGRCVTASQVKEIMNALDFEGDKLEYAKFAHDFTFDQGNYYKVNDAFGFESSIDELNEYLESK